MISILKSTNKDVNISWNFIFTFVLSEVTRERKSSVVFDQTKATCIRWGFNTSHAMNISVYIWKMKKQICVRVFISDIWDVFFSSCVLPRFTPPKGSPFTWPVLSIHFISPSSYLSCFLCSDSKCCASWNEWGSQCDLSSAPIHFYACVGSGCFNTPGH